MNGRWLARKILRLLPPKQRGKAQEFPIKQIAYLLAGTYGDFMQSLPAINTLQEKHPNANITLICPDFDPAHLLFLLPERVQFQQASWLFRQLFHPIDLILTNPIGAFRVKFDYAARFCAKTAYGFCYTDENGRSAYHFCYRLTNNIKSNMLLNMELISRTGKPITSSVGEFKNPENQYKAEPFRATHSQPDVLFHCGSTTLQTDFGTKRYQSIISEICKWVISINAPLEVIAGPTEASLLSKLNKKYPKLKTGTYSVEQLASRLEQHSGPIICFDSFMAHFCAYYKKAAIVINRELVKPGYDNSTLQTHVVLSKKTNWKLDNLFKVISSFLVQA
ncbi:MAG: hypothetical protein HQK83_08475 [Fibrobacteria bacterium]|nr:hypothetical protein [Fibrobacteria bacterium]